MCNRAVSQQWFPTIIWVFPFTRCYVTLKSDTPTLSCGVSVCLNTILWCSYIHWKLYWSLQLSFLSIQATKSSFPKASVSPQTSDQSSVLVLFPVSNPSPRFTDSVLTQLDWRWTLSPPRGLSVNRKWAVFTLQGSISYFLFNQNRIPAREQTTSSAACRETSAGVSEGVGHILSKRKITEAIPGHDC